MKRDWRLVLAVLLQVAGVTLGILGNNELEERLWAYALNTNRDYISLPGRSELAFLAGTLLSFLFSVLLTGWAWLQPAKQ